MTRARGADGLVLREAARRLAVTPRAAYRHFDSKDAWLRAVAWAARREMSQFMSGRLTGTSGAAPRLRAVGRAYIDFALAEPGWFEVAVVAGIDGYPYAPPDDSHQLDGPLPYELLRESLERLVHSGLLPPGQVEAAAITCWSGVHGFADLSARGALRTLPREAVERQAGLLLDSIAAAVVSGAPLTSSAGRAGSDVVLPVEGGEVLGTSQGVGTAREMSG